MEAWEGLPGVRTGHGEKLTCPYKDPVRRLLWDKQNALGNELNECTRIINHCIIMINDHRSRIDEINKSLQEIESAINKLS